MKLKTEKPDGVDQTTRAIVANQLNFYDLIKKYGSSNGLGIANILSAGELGLLTQERVHHLIRNNLQSHH